jgi:hypothetical protein
MLETNFSTVSQLHNNLKFKIEGIKHFNLGILSEEEVDKISSELKTSLDQHEKELNSKHEKVTENLLLPRYIIRIDELQKILSKELDFYLDNFTQEYSNTKRKFEELNNDLSLLYKDYISVMKLYVTLKNNNAENFELTQNKQKLIILQTELSDEIKTKKDELNKNISTMTVMIDLEIKKRQNLVLDNSFISDKKVNSRIESLQLIKM